MDRDLRHPQMAEQLVEVPTVLSPSLLRQLSGEQIVDISVRRGRGGSGSGGLQGSLPEQDSSAFVEQIVGIPFRSGSLNTEVQGLRPVQVSTEFSGAEAHEGLLLGQGFNSVAWGRT